MLNALTRTHARIVRKMFAGGFEKEMQNAQCGFRKGMIASYVTRILRRSLDVPESSSAPILAVILDWGKTFGRLHQHRIEYALTKFQVP